MKSHEYLHIFIYLQTNPNTPVPVKNVLVIIAFFLPILVSAQAFRSETIKYTSVNKINGDKLQRIDSVVLQINERMGDHDAEILIPYSKGDKVESGKRLQ